MKLRTMTQRVLASAALALALIAPPSRAATAVDSIVVNPLTFRIEPANPCSGDTLFLIADLCAPCGQFISAGMFEGTMRFEVFTRVGCAQQPCPVASRAVKLGAYMAGTHTLGLTTIVQTRYPDSTTHPTRLYSSITWTVRDTCPPPPPVFEPFPVYVTVAGRAPCDTCAPQLCPGEPLRVRVQGHFPNGCYSLQSITPLPVAGMIDPPYLDMRVLKQSGACTLAEVPFDTTITLSPQPLGPSVLHLSILQIDVPPPGGGEPVFHSWEVRRNFSVVDSCGALLGCVWPWLEPPATAPGECAARIQPGGVTTLPLSLRTEVGLAGLEGTLWVESPLQIQSLALGANAEGMRLEWTRTTEGVRWVMFSNATRIKPDTNAPILRVGLFLPAGTSPPPRMYVHTNVTGASDSIGGKVPVCNVRTFARPAGIAICLDGGCDVNGDGIANVRDLVRLARCLTPGTFCPDSAVLPDCDRNGVFGLDDVICCARYVLRGGARDSSDSRSAPGLGTWFGAPRASADGVELPFSLTGVGDLGSARVLLRYPTDRFEWDAAQFEGDAAGWLALSEEITPGVIALGVIQLGGEASALPWTLALKLRPGAEAGGSVTVESGEFSATDGVTLVSPVAGASSPSLGERGAARVALGAPRPNPSAGDARFAVELAMDADVDLSVHDISGRTVATLHHGRLAAGVRDFVWRGVDEAGRRAADGVYFVRLRVDGEVKSQRVTVLRGR